MALPALATTMRKCNQSAHRIPYNDSAAHHAIQRQLRGPSIASRTTTAQRIAQMQPVRRGPRIASRTTTVQRIASRTTTAQRIVQMQPVRRGPQRSAHRIPYNDRAAHRIPYNDHAAHRANATSPQRSAHRIPSAWRKCNQSVEVCASRKCIASRTTTSHRPPHTGNQTSVVRTRFAVLCAGFVWFVILTFPKFNIYTFLFPKFS